MGIGNKLVVKIQNLQNRFIKKRPFILKGLLYNYLMGFVQNKLFNHSHPHPHPRSHLQLRERRRWNRKLPPYHYSK